MKKKDLMKKKIEELPKLLDKFREELFLIKSSSVSSEDAVKRKGRQSGIRKNIARIKTRMKMTL